MDVNDFGPRTRQLSLHLPSPVSLLTEDFVTPAAWARICCHARLVNLVIHFDQHIGRHITLAEAAKVACMQRTAFSRFFRRETGISYRDFSRAFRMNRATLLMTTSDDSITQIAAAVGFSEISTFERVFKKVAGVSPKEYRKTAWKNDAIVA